MSPQVSLQLPSDDDAARESARALHELSDIAASAELPPAARLEALLGLGSRHFGLSTGVLSRVRDERFQVLSAHDAWGATRAGDEHPLAEVYCSVTIAAPGPVAFERASRGRRSRH